MEVDPLASMRCWAITLELGGREYEIPALPAVDWWPVLVAADPSQVLDLIPSRLGELDDLDTQLLNGGLDGAELGEALMDAIEAATGRSFHVAVVLAMVANAHWPVVGGALAQGGFGWDRQPIGAALDAIYAVIEGGMDKDGREKFHKLLENESLTTGKRKGIDREKAIAEFEAMAGPRPAPAPVRQRSTGEPSGSEHPRTRTPRQPRRQAARSSGPSQPPARPGGSDPQASS